MNCFNCEIVRACKTCLDLISQNKTYSTDNIMLKRQPPNEKHEMLPHYESVYEAKQIKIDFESAREIFSMKKDYEMVVEKPFERIYNLMECKSYIKSEDISENKKIIIYGFKRVQTDKNDNCILIGCESDELNEKNKVFNFSSNKFINKEIEGRDCKITRWFFMTLVKRNNF